MSNVCSSDDRHTSTISRRFAEGGRYHSIGRTSSSLSYGSEKDVRFRAPDLSPRAAQDRYTMSVLLPIPLPLSLSLISPLVYHFLFVLASLSLSLSLIRSLFPHLASHPSNTPPPKLSAQPSRSSATAKHTTCATSAASRTKAFGSRPSKQNTKAPGTPLHGWTLTAYSRGSA